MIHNIWYTLNMKTVPNTMTRGRVTATPKIDFSSFIIAYKTKSNSWRGFVMPYAVTYEASSRKKVVDVLREMVESYEEGLKKYNYPEHLKKVPLSEEEDREIWVKHGEDIIHNLLAKKSVFETNNYYGEAKLPA